MIKYYTIKLIQIISFIIISISLKGRRIYKFDFKVHYFVKVYYISIVVRQN